MKIARYHRLFNPSSGRCFDVALDHGFFNERTFLAGIENMPRTIATLVAAGPDAIQLTVGQAPHLQNSRSGPSRRWCCGVMWRTSTVPSCRARFTRD